LKFCPVEELDSVKIKCSVANRAPEVYTLSGLVFAKCNFDGRSDVKVRDCEEAHPSVADVDAESVQL